MGIGTTDLSLDVPLRCEHPRVERPERPYGPLGTARVVAAVSHLSLNYLSLAQSTPEEGARRCAIFSSLPASADVSAGGRSKGSARCVLDASCAGCVRRARSPSAAGSKYVLQIDELAFEGGSAYLFGGARPLFCGVTCQSTRFTETCCDPKRAGDQSMGDAMGARPTL